MVYAYKSNSRIKVSPQIAGSICEQLAKRGELTAKRLLEESRDESAPLHSEFEWNDSVAAESYREEQAAHIIRCIVVKTETPESSPVRAFINIKDESRDYRPINIVICSPDMREKMLSDAYRDMKIFRQKYQALTELQSVFNAFDGLKNRKEASHGTNSIYG